ATASLARAFYPAADDPSALFHAVEQGIERRDVEGEHAARSRLDELRQLVSVPGFRLEQREHEELGTAFLELGGQHVIYVEVPHISVMDRVVSRETSGERRAASRSACGEARAAKPRAPLGLLGSVNDVRGCRTGLR